MILEKQLSLIEAWDILNGINNQIDLYETLVETKAGISCSKLKEVLVSCSFTNNDKFINSIIFKDEHTTKLTELYRSKQGYEEYIRNEFERLKLSNVAICIAFMKEYKKMTWKEIASELDYSDKQCKRYYYEYKGQTPKENNFVNENVPKCPTKKSR